MVAFLFLLLSVATTATENFEDLARQAEQARLANDSSKAVSLYRRALALKPSWSEGNWRLGSLLYELSDYNGARKALNRLVASAPKSGAAYTLRGLVEYEQKDFGAALTDLRQGSALGANDDSQLENAGREHLLALLIRAAEFDEASQELTRAIQAGGSAQAFAIYAGLVALRKPMFASQVPPNEQELVALAGKAMYEGIARRAQQADEAFRTLVQRFPQAENVHYLYGSYLMASSPEAGIAELKTELQNFPRNEQARLQLIFEYLKHDDSTSALPLAEQAVEQQPRSYKAHNALGRVLLAAGQTDRAIAELERSRNLEPSSPQTHIALASAYAKAGRKEDAAKERFEFLRLRHKLDGSAVN